MQLGWPLPPECKRITQVFGERPSFNPDYYAQWGYPGHPAIDIACEIGTETYATHDGWTEPRSSEVLGEHVYVCSHDGRVKTRHSHLSVVEVRFGQRVQRGKRIGLTGATGKVTGPHLDFALKVAGEGRPDYKGWVDPEPYLRREKMSESKVASARWHAEESVREIEQRIGILRKLLNDLEATRRRLLDEVIAQLYKIEEAE